jgi:hypothetical protein
MADRLSDRYQDLLTGSYDCVDRIVLNAYFRMGHDPGGFRLWWRQLTGSDDTLDNAHLMRIAGRFSRRIRGYAKAHGIPVIDCSVGERKHDLAEEHLAKTKITQGLFLVLIGRAQAPVWDVSPNHHIERKKPMPYVNHYSFPILDPDWGHITIKISGHPDDGQLEFRRGQLEFPSHRRATAIQVGNDLYGDGSAGEAAMAADAEGVAGGCGSKSGDGPEDGTEVPARSKTAERDATKAYVANATRSLYGNMGRDSAVADGRAKFASQDTV